MELRKAALREGLYMVGKHSPLYYMPKRVEGLWVTGMGYLVHCTNRTRQGWDATHLVEEFSKNSFALPCEFLKVVP